MSTAIESMYSRLKITPAWNKWLLLESFIYYRWIKWSDKFIKVPYGFKFNGASIPRLFHIIWTPMSIDTLIPALIHDYLVDTKEYSLSETNEIFNEIMVVFEVNTLKRITYYLWVICGCWTIRFWGEKWIYRKKNKN